MPYTLPELAKMICPTPFLMALSASCWDANTLISQLEVGLSSTAGSLATFAK